MFYYLAQTFWFLCAPSHFAVWLVLAAAVLLYRNRVRAARRCAIASAAILIVAGFTPLSVWLMHPVENLYSRSTLPAHLDGILILGGGTDAEILTSRGAPNASYGLARLAAAASIARLHPEARVVFSGGPFPIGHWDSEAVAARKILIELGARPEQIVLEATSRNTWENFKNTKAIVKPKQDQRWVLVTSAFHMPRAMKIATKSNWPMIPWPSDYMTATSSQYAFREFPENLQRTDLAVHEGIGVLVYRLSGKAH
ncbi:YdcF family protein [Rhizomicrobium electricum]|uniref:YdcF family protein n=1 Tax=Rhizomicrobium electricum TaxID=480070 RepID=A0ABN1E347_9PROT|nr:YdcF family protein [Rhizomicrobium electricum]NIJ47541.1 uncharacterized SAM-binding protein YcdF (DUF218 family) [Rhizomicrobium electricum]